MIFMVEELEDLSSLGVGPGRDTHYQQPTGQAKSLHY